MVHDDVTREHEQRRQGLIDWSNQMAAVMDERVLEDIKPLAGDPARQRTWLQSSGAIAHWLERFNPSKFAVPSWSAALHGFPDRLSQARWTRLILWYALQRALKSDWPDRKIGNSFEDAYYAFLSSYSKCLATEDEGLVDAVKAAFPGVRVWRPRTEGWSRHPFLPK
jgi:hypothetical protein